MMMNEIINSQPIMNRVLPIFLFFLMLIIMASVKMIPRTMNRNELGDPVKMFIRVSKNVSVSNFIIYIPSLLISSPI